MTSALLAVALLASGPTAPPAPETAAPQAPAKGTQARVARTEDSRPAAYYQFLLGRHLESEGDADGALAAYKRALELDPSSAEIRVELATAYARRGELADATAVAKAALERDPENVEAHRLLGMISAEDAERETRAPGGDTAARQAARTAIDHLERALRGARLETATGIRLALGRLWLRTDEPDKAVAVLRQAITDEPGLPQAVTLLVEAYTLAGQSAAAIDLLRDAVQQDPALYASLGEAYDKEQRWSEAAAAYGRAAERSPRDNAIRTRWAQALLNTEETANIRQARDLLLELTQANPTSGWPLYLLVRAQRESGDLDGAEHSARRLLALTPTGVSGAHALAQVLAQKRAFADVITALAPVVDKLPKGREADQALLLTHLGFAYLETHRLPEAVASFERALALSPDDEALPTYLGQALNAARQHDRALAVVRPRRAARPADVRLARVEADALRGQGQVDAGAAVLQALIDQPTATASAFQALGEYYASARRYADAARVLESALTRYADDVDVMFQHAAMLERQGRRADAERAFRAVLAKDASHAPALNYLGYMLTESGQRLPEALQLVTRAVDLEPHNGAYLDSLGWTYFRLGNLDEAEKHLGAAARQLPRDSVVQDHWGDLLAKRGRTAEAVEAWKRALAGDGETIDHAAIEQKIKHALARQR